MAQQSRCNTITVYEKKDTMLRRVGQAFPAGMSGGKKKLGSSCVNCGYPPSDFNNSSQYSLLVSISRLEGCGTGQLARHVKLEKSTLVRTLQPLFRDGLIVGIAVLLGLTAAATVVLTAGLVGKEFSSQTLGTLFCFVFLCRRLGSFSSAWLGGVCLSLTGNHGIIWCAVHTCIWCQLPDNRNIAPCCRMTPQTVQENPFSQAPL